MRCRRRPQLRQASRQKAACPRQVRGVSRATENPSSRRKYPRAFSCRQLFNYIRYIEYHHARVAVLALFAVDVAANVKLGHCANFVGGEYARAHGSKIVKTLAEIPLLMARLKIARRYVVDDSVAEYVLACVGCFDVLCVPADDNTKLDFVVQAVANVKMSVDLISGCDSALKAL